MSNQADVLIVGAGLAGLACALELTKGGAEVLLLEASDRPGGRVRTDQLDGFLLDRGFQVLLTAYPETQRTLDYEALQLGTFKSGALVRSGGRFQTLADPLRSPLDAVATVLAPLASLKDKIKIAEFRARVSGGSLEDLLRRPEMTTIAELEQMGLSSSLVEGFFRPFLGGVFLEPWLATSSRKFEFVFRMFAQGEAALPADGMEAIPKQLTSLLPPGCIRTNTPVTAAGKDYVETSAGELIKAREVVIATAEPEMAGILKSEPPKTWCSALCLYFDAPEPPIEGPWLVLNGEGGGPVNNLCVPSNVASGYAPQGRSLVSASIPGDPPSSDDDLESDVRVQLRQWYGPVVREWRHLRTYRIHYAVPLQSPGAMDGALRPSRVAGGPYVCGDYTDVASIHGAMVSGRTVAETILGSA